MGGGQFFDHDSENLPVSCPCMIHKHMHCTARLDYIHFIRPRPLDVRMRSAGDDYHVSSMQSYVRIKTSRQLTPLWNLSAFSTCLFAVIPM